MLPPVPNLPTDPARAVLALHTYLQRLRRHLEASPPGGSVTEQMERGGMGLSDASIGRIQLPDITDFGDVPVPLNVSAFGLINQIALCWNVHPDVTVSSYEVQRATDSGFTANVVVLIVTKGLTWYDNNVPTDSTFYYRVRAVRPAFPGAPLAVSDWSETVTATTLAAGDEQQALLVAKQFADAVQRAHLTVVGPADDLTGALGVSDRDDASLMSWTADSAEHTILTLGPLRVTSGVVQISVSIGARIANATDLLVIRIYRGVTLIFQSGIDLNNTNLTMNEIDTPGIGTWTYEARVIRTAGASADTQFVAGSGWILEVRR